MDHVDRELEAHRLCGLARLENKASHGHTTLPPPARSLSGDRLLQQRHREQLPSSTLRDVYFLELLRRAEALLYFVDNNVGPTRDFPVMMSAEGEAAARMMCDRLNDLRNVVGCLTEM